jgi:predicted GNAT family N-acyltransferase
MSHDASSSAASSAHTASGASASTESVAQDGLLWSVKPFDAVSPRELYAALRLRSEVFVVEQNCVFLDMDDQDQKCLMVMGYQRHENDSSSSIAVPPSNDPAAGSVGTSIATTASASGSSSAAAPVPDGHKLVATARLFAPRDSPYAGYACIGRVCTSPGARRSGCGRALLTRCVTECAARYRTVPY